MTTARPLALTALMLSACLGPGRKPVRNATPMAGSPDDMAAPGQSACEAATLSWPESPGLDRTIEDRMDAGHLLGLSACIVKHGDVVWCGAYGRVAVDGSAVTTDTPFIWASVSKLVTATSVAMLEADGKLDFDQDIDAQLPFTVQHPDGGAIRPRAVLAHVGGISDNNNAMDTYYSANEDPTMSLEQVNRGYFDPSGADYSASRNFVDGGPEARFRYTNMGYSLLGSLVESASGTDFSDWSAANIFGPLGMQHTSWRVSDFDLSELAEPTTWVGGNWQPEGHTTFADFPNGGLRSSAHDMACFMAMAARGGTLYGTQILKMDDLHAMMDPAYPALAPDQGLGWGYEDLGDPQEWVGHSGGELGVASDFYMNQSGELGFVLVTNGDWGRSTPILDIEDALVAFGQGL